MSDKTDKKSINAGVGAPDDMPASCSGVWGRDFIATAADEKVYHFLSYFKRNSLLNFIHPDDALRFTAWWHGLNAKSETGIVVKINRGNGDTRNVYMKGRAVDDDENRNLLNIEMIDIERICENYAELLDDVTKITAFHEYLEGCEFEYDAVKKKVSLFRYVSAERIPETDKDLVSLIPVLTERLRRVKSKPDLISEIIQGKDGRGYSVEGACLYRNFELSSIYGRVRRNDQRFDDLREAMPIEKTDSFTGLWNKVASLEYLRNALEDPSVHQVVVFMMDLDYFKNLNDSYGHAFGDEAILRMSQIIKSVIKGRGIGARFGGDEFMLVLKDLGSESAIRAVAESIRTQISWAFPETVIADRITCTIGISESPRNGTDFETIFNKADRALYIGKQKGKNRYIIYKEHLHGELPQSGNVSLEQGIRDALNVDTLLDCSTSCLKTLNAEGSAGIKKVAKKLLALYGMERLSIYTGPDLELYDYYGAEARPVESLAGFLKPEANGLLDKYGICQISFEFEQRMFVEEIHNALEKNGIKEISIFARMEDNTIKTLVCFERLNEKEKADSRKWSDEELHFLTLVSRMIAETLK